MENELSREQIEAARTGGPWVVGSPTLNALCDMALAYLDAKVDAREYLAGKLIDSWCAEHGGKITWAKAVQIAAIVTKQSDAERDLLLHIDDDNGACGMCGRSDAAIDQAMREGKGDGDERSSL